MRIQITLTLDIDTDTYADEYGLPHTPRDIRLDVQNNARNILYNAFDPYLLT
jgi:hypothetical protein